jgi:hypothetical protein
MIRNTVFVGLTRFGSVLLLLSGLSRPALAAEVTLTRTNWNERWITNVVEVRMPVNRFVNQYRTNLVEQVRERVVNVYATNWVTRSLTNRVAVSAIRTNFVEISKTNWQTVKVTRVVPIELIRTNFVDNYRTNWATLDLTNWHTVVVRKTNWITQPVTKTEQVDLIASQGPSGEATTAKDAVDLKAGKAEVSAALPAAIPTDAVLLNATQTGRTVGNHQIEVRLTVKWASGAAAPFLVQNWKVERLDGAILCFGQDQEFKRQLPLGEYKVEVRGQQDEKSPLLVARGTLSLTANEAIIRQKMLVKR